MRTGWFYLAAALLLILSPTVRGQSELPVTDTPPAVQTLRLSPAPLWVSSGSLSPDNDTLVVVDGIRSTVSRYDLASLDGHSLLAARTGQLTARDWDLREAFRPSRIQRMGEEYLLQVEDCLYRLQEREGQFFYENHTPPKAPFLDVMKAAARPGLQIAGLYRWRASDEGVFAYVDIRRAEDQWTSAFVWIPSSQPSAFEIVHEVPLDSRAREYSLLIEPLIAEVKGKFYFLTFEDPPRIYGFHPSGEVEVHSVLAAPYRDLPRLPSPLRSTSAAAFYGVIEKARMPAGLLAEDDRLYLLTREPAESGRTRWKVHQLDEGGESLGHRELSSTAPHLTLLPGQKIWVAIERGKVGEYLQQDNSKAVLIAASWIEERPQSKEVRP